MQLELGIAHPNEHLWSYWRSRLQEWPREVYRFRHMRKSSGWSSAINTFVFARLLYIDGQLSKSEFRRYCRFDRRLKRIWQADPPISYKVSSSIR